MSFTNSQLAQKVSDLIGYWSGFAEEYADWLGGTVNGGPNLDGRYPLTDWNGIESLVKSPAQLQEDVDGMVSSASASATAAAASAAAALASENEATTQAGLADTARIAAETAETNAETAESSSINASVNATASQNAAASSASAAATSEANASASEVAAAASAAAAAASAVEAATFDPDLFYTRVALDGGQLDTRYYTESEVDALIAGIDLSPYAALAGATFTGDVTIANPATLSFGSTVRQMLNLHGTSYALGVESNTLYFRADSLFRWYFGVADDGSSDVMELSNTGLALTGILTSANISPIVMSAPQARMDFTGSNGPLGIQWHSSSRVAAEWVDLVYRTTPKTLAFERHSDFGVILSLDPSDLSCSFGGDIYFGSSLAIRGNDTWLRLNQNGSFTSGVFTPGKMRADGGFQADKANDTAASPSFTWNDDADCGMFGGGANVIGWSTGGTQRMTLGSTGRLTLDTAYLSTPSSATPAQLASGSTTHNYNPSSDAAVFRLSSGGAASITGIAGGVDGRILLIVNIGANTITLLDENAGSTAANRISSPGSFGGGEPILAGRGVMLWYDGTSSRWRAIAVS